MDETTVRRYSLPFPSAVDRSFTIDMPDGARVVHVGVADERPREPSMWVEQPRTRPQPRRFYSVGMGMGFGALEPALAGEYVGTWRMNGNTWHVFEEGK